MQLSIPKVEMVKVKVAPMEALDIKESSKVVAAVQECNSRTWWVLWPMWAMALVLSIVFIYHFVEANNLYTSRVYSNCFLKDAELDSSRWMYEFEHKTYTTIRHGAPLVSPVVCYVSLTNPEDVAFDWPVPSDRTFYARASEITIGIFILISAGVSLLKLPCTRKKTVSNGLTDVLLADLPAEVL